MLWLIKWGWGQLDSSAAACWYSWVCLVISGWAQVCSILVHPVVQAKGALTMGACSLAHDQSPRGQNQPCKCFLCFWLTSTYIQLVTYVHYLANSCHRAELKVRGRQVRSSHHEVNARVWMYISITAEWQIWTQMKSPTFPLLLFFFKLNIPLPFNNTASRSFTILTMFFYTNFSSSVFLLNHNAQNWTRYSTCDLTHTDFS